MRSAWTIAPLVLACIFAGAWAATFLRGQSVRLLHALAAFFMARTKAERVFIGAVFIALWIVAGTKSGGDRGAPLASPFSPEDFERGFVMARVGTNETFDFSPPQGAAVNADWKAFGAAEDWTYESVEWKVEKGKWKIDCGDGGGTRLRVFSNGKAQPCVTNDADSIATNLWFAPLSAPLGILPKANWIAGNGEWGMGNGEQGTGNGELPSLFWHCVSPSNTLRLTWRNALLNRDTNTPVSVQVELSPNGRLAYRYDLSRTSVEEVTNILVGAALGGPAWTTNALPADVTSLTFHPLSAEDATTPDRDGDGLSLADELFTYATDPDIYDTDFDGIGDGEEVALGANPLSRDSDGDGFADATDVNPTSQDAWDDLDGDGLPDVWEDGWFGPNAAAAAFGDANADGVSNIASLMMGLNPVAPPAEGFVWTGASSIREINAWEIVPVAFSFERPAGLTNLVSRTFTMNRESPWEQFLVSSRPDRAAGWEMAGAALLYGLDGGPVTNAMPSVSYDSWHVPLGEEMPQEISFCLEVTGPAPSLSAPLYLLRWTPCVEFLPSENVSVIAATNGHVYAAAKRNPGTGAFEIPFRVDTSKFPHQAGIDALTAADLALSPVGGVAVSNGIPRLFMAADPLRTDLPPEGANPSKRLLFYSVDIERPGSVSPGPRSSRYASPYPLTSSALRKSFHAATGVTASGGVTVRVSPDVPELGFSARSRPLRGGAPLRGTDSGGSKPYTFLPPLSGSPTVLDDPCTNDVYNIDFEYPEDHDDTQDEDDGYVDEGDECECGDDGGASLGSFRIRIPFGESAADENLGYLWAAVDGPVDVRPSVFGVLAAPSVSVATNANGTLHISCPSAGGKTLMVTNIAHGVAVPGWNASGRFESQWEVWNENGDPSRIRVRCVTVLGNATVDETFATWDEDEPVVFGEDMPPATVWGKTDNIRGVTTTRREWRDASDPDFVAEEYEETALAGRTVRAVLRTYARIGEGSAARRRLAAEYGYDEDGWFDTARTYWCDTDHPARHARLKSLRSSRQPWSWRDYDDCGRETVRFEQMDGSEFPGLDAVSLDAPLSRWCSAKVTVTGYEPPPGDAAHRNDSFEPREVTVYVRRNGGAPVAVSHETRRYTRETDAAGNPLRRVVRTTGLGGLARTETTVEYPRDAAVPSHLRGRTTLSTAADGSTTMTAYALSNGFVVATARTAFGGAWRPTYMRTVSDAAYRLPLREETRLTEGDAVVEWSERSYDDLRRLRAVAYSDGTFETNAYSCCRLLWRRDREGRTTLRSAQTGTDSLYYADEDVWLGDISTNGGFRVTQHFFDGLGRETNTVTYASTLPGAADTPSQLPNPSLFSQTTTAYFDDWLSGASETTDGRGAVTARSRYADGGCEQDWETLATNGVDVICTTTTTWRGGGTVIRREWETMSGGSPSSATAWTEERRFTEYDALGRRVEYAVTESSDGPVVTNSVSTYDLLGRLVSTAAPGANGATIVTVHAYDGATSRLLSSTTTGSPTVTYGYNEFGERTTTTQDGASILTLNTYETISQEVYRVTATMRLTGAVTNAVRIRKVRMTGLSNALRSRVVSVDASGHETVEEQSFDPDTGILTTTSQTDGASPVVVRSLHGVTLSREALGGAQEWAYDALGRIVAVATLDALGATNRIDLMEYDQSGNVVRSVSDFMDGRVAESSAEYDMLNREFRRTDALGKEVEVGHDAIGRIVAMDGDTYPLRFGYDTLGRKTHGFTTRDNGVTWDETRWAYDAASGLNISKTYADGSHVYYDYTDNGRRTRTTWARGAWREDAWNVRNLVGGTTYSGADTPSSAYTYADSGKVASATLSDGTSYTYAYDKRLLCTNEIASIGGETFAVTRTYDGHRRELGTAIVATNAAYAAKTRLYDNENRVCGYALTNAAGRGVSVSLAYDGLYLTNMAYALPNGGCFSVALTREAARRELVMHRAYAYNGQSAYWHSTDYDLIGRPTNATDSVSLAREWLYNPRSELAAATIGTNRYGYAYDSIGNRLWSAANAATNSYSANSLNQYTSILCGSASPCEPSYDADGNLLADGAWSYAYDAENRLVSATSAALTNGAIRVLNTYDHRHRRVRKTVQRLLSTIPPPPSPPVGEFEWQTVETRTFVYDGNNIVLETVESADGATSVREYFWGLDKSGTEQGAGGVEGLLAVSMDGVFNIPCYDHNGNIVRYVSETGAVAAQYLYDPYGNVVEADGLLADVFSFGFSTKYHDRETGMVGYKRRFYRPDLGRWLNRDPIEEDGGENLYAFCGNSPILYIDILGEDFWGYFMDAVKVVSGLFTMKTGAGMIIGAGWTGAGLVGGMALFALGADQLAYGAQNIKNRIQGKGIETGTLIQKTYRYVARQISGVRESTLEKSLDYTYLGAEITAACATGYISVSRTITAVRSTEAIHTAGHWIINPHNYIEYEFYISGGVSVYEAGTVVASESFNIVISSMSFIDSPENAETPVVEGIEHVE